MRLSSNIAKGIVIVVSAKRKEVQFNPGKPHCEIAFVFACPGQEEWNNKKPVSGATGKNLDRLLNVLHQYQPKLFIYTCRYDYCITNASSKVYYKGYINNRTLPSLREDVYTPENINRLKEELHAKKLVVSFGNTANRALSKAEIPHIEAKCHLGYQGINQISMDCNGNSILKGNDNATTLRIEVVAKDILEKISYYLEATPSGR